MHLGLKTKILLYFSLLIAVIAGNYVFVMSAQKDAKEQQGWVSHTHEVINGAFALLGSLTDVETGQRGFLLTHEISYLEPYDTGLSAANASHKHLQELTSDNPVQQIRLNTIRSLMTKKFAELDETIRETQLGRPEVALDIVKSNLGKRIMDEIRSELMVFTDLEEQLLEQRNATFLDQQKSIQNLFIGEALLLILVLVVMASMIQKGIVQPITILTRSAVKLGAGEDVAKIEVQGNDEICQLTEAFNLMRKQVKGRAEELKIQAHYDQSFSHAVSACSSSHDLGRALSDALITHAVWHPCPLGAVYLYNGETDKLDCIVTHGTSEAVKKEVPSRSGLIGQAYRANEPMIVGAESAEGFHIDAGLATISPRAVLLQPINYNDNMLGVLVLAYTEEPTDRDRHYIGNLAYQFGITIVGAQRYSDLQKLSKELEESRAKVTVERDKAVEKSITDPLTKLHNRGYFQVELERMILTSTRYEQELALIILDIDFFKKINYTLGHLAGDQALKALAAVLLKQTRASDLVARYGGEEFVVVLPQVTVKEVQEIAEKLRKAVEETVIEALEGKNLTISLGVAMLGEDDKNMDDFIHRADEALYKAKHNGRNQVQMAKPK